MGGFAPAIVQHAGKGQLRDPMAGCTPVAPTTSRWRATGSPSPATGRLCSCLLAGAVAALQEREGDFGLGQHPLMGTHLIDGTDQVVGVESRADRERAGGGSGGRGRAVVTVPGTGSPLYGPPSTTSRICPASGS